MSTTEITLSNTGDYKAMPFFLLSIFVIRELRKRPPPQVCDDEYESISFSSIASSISKYENSSPPPLDVFLSSRKKEGNSAEEKSFMLSPGYDTHENDNAELLDAETSRTFEVQFVNHELYLNRESCTSFEFSQDDRGGCDLSYDIGDERTDNELQQGKIIINSDKSILPRLQDKACSDDTSLS